MLLFCWTHTAPYKSQVELFGSIHHYSQSVKSFSLSSGLFHNRNIDSSDTENHLGHLVYPLLGERLFLAFVVFADDASPKITT